jgi:hypothetical protein
MYCETAHTSVIQPIYNILTSGAGYGAKDTRWIEEFAEILMAHLEHPYQQFTTGLCLPQAVVVATLCSLLVYPLGKQQVNVKAPQPNHNQSKG